MADVSDLKLAFDALVEKQDRYTILWRYYDGAHPLVYSNKRLQEVFDTRDEVNFSQNWCAVVVDSVLDRVQLKQLSVSDNEQLTQELTDLFGKTELELDAVDAHRAALVCGESFIVAERIDDGMGGQETEVYYNDPRLCHVFYDPDNPRQKKFAAKWWVGLDKKRYITLYYADRFEYYVSTHDADNVSSEKGFVVVPEYDGGNWPTNEWGVIPVFHFRRERRTIQSLLANVIGPQAAFNKLFSDMMVAAEFGAFKQRWVISNADVGTLKNSPNEVWDIPGGDGMGQQTAVGEFSATELGNYTAAMETIATNISRITRLPKHYFLATGGDPSGEALIAMEAPLNRQTQAFINNVAVTWRKLAAFLLMLDNQGEIEASDIEPVFEPPETVQPRTEAEIRQINGNAGIPLKTSLRWEGKTPQEIQQVEDEIAEEKTAKADLAQAYLEAARAQLSQGGNGDNNLQQYNNQQAGQPPQFQQQVTQPEAAIA